MAKVGRPTDYQETYNEQSFKLCLLGATDTELADFFGIQESTLNLWKKAHPKFMESIRNGKDIANANVAHSMYQKAVGYSHAEDKIFNNNGKAMVVKTTKHYPPDTQAGSLFLRNRTTNPNSIGLNWRDKTEQEVKHNINLTDLSEDELNRKLQQAEQQNDQSTKD